MNDKALKALKASIEKWTKIAETGEYVHWLEARVIEERLGESEPELTSPVTHEEAEALTREADKRAPHA